MKKSLGAKTILFPAPTLLIGSYDKDGKPNAATVAWGGICCSVPPCVAISLRAATYSHGNIMAKKAFTVNVPSQAFAKAVDFCGMVSGKTVDKFAKTGLTPVKSDLVDAPYIKEFPLVLECKVIKVVEIGLHTQFIGEILDVKAENDVLFKGSIPDVEKIQPILFDPEARTYHGVGENLGQAFAIGKGVA